MSDFKIDISVPKAQFERHLDLENNRRIIFSGPFGSGKTYFLKEFFEQNEKFTFIRLAPVNYSVAQNEDIFELIKFDILFHLLEKELFPEDDSALRTHILRHITLLAPEKGLRGILEKANKIGADISQISSDFKESPLVTQDSTADLAYLEELKKFLDKITGEAGGVYEYDVLTQLLYKLISKVGSESKESVLVIDDLDRIDPEHIFRILNVFAAHFDLNETGNKFGFRRVILVCDLDNIRRIFATRYGLDVDFSGYIDKFYSREVFCFDNSLAMRKELSRLLSTVEVNLSGGGQVDMRLFPIQNWDDRYHKFIIYVFEALLLVNGTNLRSIRKIRNYRYGIEMKQIGRSFQSNQFPIIWILEFIKSILGDGISLRNAIQKCVAAKIGLEIYDEQDGENHLKLGLIIPSTLIPKVNVSENRRFQISDGITLNYSIVRAGFNNDVFYAQIREGEKNPIDIFPALLDAIDIFQRMGLLK